MVTLSPTLKFGVNVTEVVGDENVTIVVNSTFPFRVNVKSELLKEIDIKLVLTEALEDATMEMKNVKLLKSATSIA